MRVRDRDMPSRSRMGELSVLFCTRYILYGYSCGLGCWLCNSRDLPRRPSYISSRIKLHPSPMVFSECRRNAASLSNPPPSFNIFSFGWPSDLQHQYIVDASSMRKIGSSMWERKKKNKKKKKTSLTALFRGVYETGLFLCKPRLLFKETLTVCKQEEEKKIAPKICIQMFGHENRGDGIRVVSSFFIYLFIFFFLF